MGENAINARSGMDKSKVAEKTTSEMEEMTGGREGRVRWQKTMTGAREEDGEGRW